jgi:hypothetical protein
VSTMQQPLAAAPPRRRPMLGGFSAPKGKPRGRDSSPLVNMLKYLGKFVFFQRNLCYIVPQGTI